MDRTLEQAVTEWHAAVNDRDPDRLAAVVGDPVVVLGPRGAGTVTPAELADWTTRSGITLVARARHPVADDLVVVEQDATWPGAPEPAPVATVFRVTGGRVTAALRLPDTGSALELARVCHAMAVTR